MNMARICFLGVGKMGLPMASHLLQAGHAVAVSDPSPERLALAQGAARSDRSTWPEARSSLIPARRSGGAEPQTKLPHFIACWQVVAKLLHNNTDAFIAI